MKKATKQVEITAPDMEIVGFTIVGTAPYVQNKFSQKAKDMMRAAQEAGPKKKAKKQLEAKDFQAVYENAKHVSDDGWVGIPAPAFRNAMISACKIIGFVMTRAKLMVFIEADGFDAEDQTPLVKITKGKPEYVEHFVRNETGVADIRPRPMWKPGWEATVRVKFDKGQFTVEDMANLLARAGAQVGIGEGRPDSKKSCGMGWGLFEHKPK